MGIKFYAGCLPSLVVGMTKPQEWRGLNTCGVMQPVQEGWRDHSSQAPDSPLWPSQAVSTALLAEEASFFPLLPIFL